MNAEQEKEMLKAVKGIRTNIAELNVWLFLILIIVFSKGCL